MFCVSGEVGQNELDIHKAADNLFWMLSVAQGTAAEKEKCLHFNGNSQHAVNDKDASHKINVFISLFYCFIVVKA